MTRSKLSSKILLPDHFPESSSLLAKLQHDLRSFLPTNPPCPYSSPHPFFPSHCPQRQAQVAVELCKKERWKLCRCRLLPLLSQQHLQLHRDHPPICKTLLVKAPVKPLMLSQFRWLAKVVEGLEIRLPDKPNARNPKRLIGMLPELLAMAATAAPILRTLSVFELRLSTGAVMSSCACLTQITKLCLGEVNLLEREGGLGTSVEQIWCLTKLHALEVRNQFHSTMPVTQYIILQEWQHRTEINCSIC